MEPSLVSLVKDCGEFKFKAIKKRLLKKISNGRGILRTRCSGLRQKSELFSA
jgi:hypothetical protein